MELHLLTIKENIKNINLDFAALQVEEFYQVNILFEGGGEEELYFLKKGGVGGSKRRGIIKSSKKIKYM